MPCKMQRGFWPSTSYTMGNGSMIDSLHEDTTPIGNSRDLFCGIAHDKRKALHNPYKDVMLNDFVLGCHPDTNIYPMWMSQTLTSMQLNKNHSHCGQNSKFGIGDQAKAKEISDLEC
jgi:hypothetical protein